MLKKIIATAMSFALLANAGMIASANESFAETSVVVAETEITSESETTTAIATEESTVAEETTITEAESSADVGEALRLSLDVKVRDIVVFYDVQRLYDADGNEYYVNSGWNLWIIGADDENQRFRVQSPKLTPNGEVVTFLTYEDAKNAVCVSHDGCVRGDLTYDGIVNVFDMCLMRRGFIYGWGDDTTSQIIADMNYDGEVTVADLVWLQRWLLGAIK